MRDKLMAELEQVNNALALLVTAEVGVEQTAQLMSLTSQRDELIQQCLALLEGAEKKRFAEAEYQRNQDFSEKANTLLEQARIDAINFVQNKKNANRYTR